MNKKKLKICGYYTPNYIQYVRSFLNTYKGEGDIWLQPVEDIDRHQATSIKARMFKNSICGNYAHYVFADVDLLFSPTFCFSELCKPDSLGIIVRDQFKYPQRAVNSSIVALSTNLAKDFLDEWYRMSTEPIIDNVHYRGIAPTDIENSYYWDQVSLNHVYTKFKYHKIPEDIYLAQKYSSQVKILSPHAYDKGKKEKMYEELLNEVFNNWQ